MFDGVKRHFQQYFSYIVAVSFIGRGNQRKPQVTDKLYHIMLYTSPRSRFELTTPVVIGTDCIGSCKSSYHTITATTPPPPLTFHIGVIYKQCYISLYFHQSNVSPINLCISKECVSL